MPPTPQHKEPAHSSLTSSSGGISFLKGCSYLPPPPAQHTHRCGQTPAPQPILPKRPCLEKCPNFSAAAAKSLQSCPTLCDPIDGSPPGSSVPGILQARTLEWVAISFSNACMHAKSLQSCQTLCDPIDSSPPGSSVHRIF